MKTTLTKHARMLLFFCLIAISKVGLAQTNAAYTITNVTAVNSNEFQFDIFVRSTGVSSFELSTYSFGINFNSAIRNGGTMTWSYIAGSTGLSVAGQAPSTCPAGNFLVNTVSNQLRFNACLGLGTGAGASSVIPLATVPAPLGVKIGRFKVTNTVTYTLSSTPNLAWSLANSGANTTKTGIGYYAPANTAITLVAGNLTVDGNPILAQPACVPPAFSQAITPQSCSNVNDGAIALTITNNPTITTTTVWSGGTPSVDGLSVTGLAPGLYTATITNTAGCTTVAGPFEVLAGAQASSVFTDFDNDGFGTGSSFLSCAPFSGPADGLSGVGGDCDDNNPAVHSTQLFFVDFDQDNFGSAVQQSVCALSPPTGFSSVSGDCNDNDPSAHVLATYFIDNDADGFGSTFTQDFCAATAPNGFSATGGDCNDILPGGAAIYPGQTEVCNQTDDDCDNSIDEGLPTQLYFTDADGDTYGVDGTEVPSCAVLSSATRGGDCNDVPALGGASVNPGVLVDACNHVDNDCDGLTDEDATFTVYFTDNDGDHFGTTAELARCDNPGTATVGGDCDDTNPAINPSVSEVCNGVDDDCVGGIDNGLLRLVYTDADSDGYGTGTGSMSCAPVGGSTQLSLVAGDCNDADEFTNPGIATDLCNDVDNDCDGSTDEDAVFVAVFTDADNDQYGTGLSSQSCHATGGLTGLALVGGDCNDSDASVNPGFAGSDFCNDVDNDCDGQTDENAVFVDYFVDNDADQYGAGSAVSRCSAPASGYATVAGDCDDNAPLVNPGRSEVCNGIDDDCVGGIDNGLLRPVFTDSDDDGFGGGSSFSSCAPVGSGTGLSLVGGDCADNNPAVNPSALEVCNGIDDDCAGGIDNGLTFVTYFTDADFDNYGVSGSGVSRCDNPGTGFATVDGDCDDTRASAHPLAVELCNGLDDDCDLTADNGLPFTTYYTDADGDSYGAVGSGVSRCDNPGSGFVTTDGDCNDLDGQIHPNQTDACNHVDDDCDGSVDEDATFTVYFTDNDLDTYGTSAQTARCDNPGTALVGGDCNDNDASVNPGVLVDGCNHVDNDCDGDVDEDATFTVYFTDLDGDHYGTTAELARCDNPGTATVGGDCDDTRALTNPGATEQCNGIDDNCDLLVDNGVAISTFYLDFDGDGVGTSSVHIDSCAARPGYVALSGDCDDNNPAIVTPIVYYRDFDTDSFGDLATTTSSCTTAPPSGFVSNSLDCDDLHFTYADVDGDSFGAGPALACGAVTNADDCDDAHFTYGDVDGDGFGFGLAVACGAVTNALDCDDAHFTYADADGDGFGFGPALACGQSFDNTDCNDARLAHADADGDGFGSGPFVACGGVENELDCNDARVAYGDVDGDGFGFGPFVACGGVTNDSDCDDAHFTYADNDLDGFGFGPALACGAVTNDADCDDNALLYADNDGDTFGAGAPVACGVASNTDCDDNNIAIHEPVIYYADLDGDGYGDFSNHVPYCSFTAPSGATADFTDCNDNPTTGGAAMFPGNPEVCGDMLDNNCSGVIDEGCLCMNPTTANAGGNQTICVTQTVQLHGTIGGSATNGTWSTLNGTGSFSNVADLNAVYTPSPADYAAGSVTLTLTTDGVLPCVPAQSDAVITFENLPANPGAISGPSSACNPASGSTLTFSIADIGAASYTWSLPAGLTVVGNATGRSITVGYVATALHFGINGFITVQANNSNGCGSSTPSSMGFNANLVAPVQPGSISGADAACPNDVKVYSVAGVVRASFYTWVMPPNAQIIAGAGSNVITVQYLPGFSGGTITVAAGNGCGVSPTRARVVTFNKLAAPASITGNATGVCASTQPYCAASVTGAMDYVWTAPAGASFAGGINTGQCVSIIFSGSFTGGNVTVSATNNCGAGTARVMNVIGAPAFPAAISGPLSFCATVVTEYSIPTVTGASSYTWTKTTGLAFGNGTAALSGQGTKQFRVTFGGPVSSQTLTVRAVNACGQSNARVLDNISVVSCPRLGDVTSDLNLIAYPNPVNEVLSVTFNSTQEQNYTLRMMDATGRVVVAEEKAASTGSNQLELNVKNLASGLYMLQFQMADRTEQIRIFVD